MKERLKKIRNEVWSISTLFGIFGISQMIVSQWKIFENANVEILIPTIAINLSFITTLIFMFVYIGKLIKTRLEIKRIENDYGEALTQLSLHKKQAVTLAERAKSYNEGIAEINKKTSWVLSELFQATFQRDLLMENGINLKEYDIKLEQQFRFVISDILNYAKDIIDVATATNNTICLKTITKTRSKNLGPEETSVETFMWSNKSTERKNATKIEHKLSENSILRDLYVRPHFTKKYHYENDLINSSYTNTHNPGWRKYYNANYVYILIHEDNTLDTKPKFDVPVGFLCIDQLPKQRADGKRVGNYSENTTKFVEIIAESCYLLVSMYIQYLTMSEKLKKRS